MIVGLLRVVVNNIGILKCHMDNSILRIAGGTHFAGHVSHSRQQHKAGFENREEKFDENILKVIVCPLTKKPLRYDKERQLLISDDIGVGYKVVNGIPNLVPQDGIKIDKGSS